MSAKKFLLLAGVALGAPACTAADVGKAPRVFGTLLKCANSRGTRAPALKRLAWATRSPNARHTDCAAARCR